MLDDLNKLVKNGETHLEVLKVKIDSKWTEDDVNAVIQFFNDNTLQISHIELSFENCNLTQRSTLMLAFLPLFSHIHGLEKLTLNDTFKDYALIPLFSNPSLLQLKALSFTHNSEDLKFSQGKRNRIFVNKTETFEVQLVEYLKNNQQLTSLTIDDSNADISAIKYPGLKKALCAHPSLEKFSQGSITDLGLWSENKKGLVHNKYLQASLQRKKVIDPNQLIAQFNQMTDQVLDNIKQLDKDFAGFKDINTMEQWQLVINRLTHNLDTLIFFKDNYKKLPTQSDQVKKQQQTIDILYNYVYLLIKVAILHQISITPDVKIISPFNNEIEFFWDKTRNDLAKRLDNSNDYDKLLKDMSTEQTTIDAIFKDNDIVFTRTIKTAFKPTYPSSYKKIVKDLPETLLQARALLDDYTKHYSVISRFFHGHWNRHHVSDVNTILQRKDIDSVEELLGELEEVRLVNPNGSLAKRIQFIKDNILQPEVQPGMQLK